jgi:hypothetical protein
MSRNINEEAGFDVPEYRKAFAIMPPEFKKDPVSAHNEYARKVPGSASFIKNYADAAERLETLGAKNTLTSSELRELKMMANKITRSEAQMARVVAAYKAAIVGARPAKSEAEHEAKANRAIPPLERLRKIGSASLEKTGTPEESFDWKARVKEYLGEGKVKFGFEPGKGFDKKKTKAEEARKKSLDKTKNWPKADDFKKAFGEKEEAKSAALNTKFKKCMKV